MSSRLAVALAFCAGCADGFPQDEPDLGGVDLASPSEVDLGAPQPAGLDFVAARDYAAAGGFMNGWGAGEIARLDWNGDGIADLAVADVTAGEVRLLRGLPGGRFVSDHAIPVGTNPLAIAAGDFNGDQRSDLVVSTEEGPSLDRITLLLGDGQGGFNPSSSGSGPGTVEFALGDFDGDGHLDISASGSDPASVLLGDGKGNLAPTAFYFTTGGGSIAAGDLDGDGTSDLLVVSGQSAGVMLASGKGAFLPPVAYGSAVGVATLGDLDGDGLLDIVATTDAGVQVLFNMGQAQFAAPVDTANAGTNRAILLGDWNGDGKPDLLLLRRDSLVADLVLQTGKGQFGPPSHPRLTDSVDYVVGGDFNQDGKTDFATSDSLTGQVRVFLADPDGAMIAAPIDPESPWHSGLAVADFDGDGKPDIAGGIDRHQVGVQAGDGKGGVAAPVVYATTVGDNLELLATDLDGDGAVDLVASGYEDSGQAWIEPLMNDGKGNFSEAAGVPFDYGIWQVAAEDLDGDGRRDLVVALTDSPPTLLRVLLGNGDGTFQPGLYYYSTGCKGLASIAIADWNGDGIADLAAGDGSTNQFTLLLGQPQGKFALPQHFPTVLSPSALAAGDFDGDGKPDLAAATSDDGITTNLIEIRRGNGDGTFLAPTTVPSGISINTLALADLDGDKRPELIAVSVYGGNVEVFANLGAPGFAPGIWFASGGRSYNLAVGDLNLDGKPDLVSSTEDGLAFLINVSK